MDQVSIALGRFPAGIKGVPDAVSVRDVDQGVLFFFFVLVSARQHRKKCRERNVHLYTTSTTKPAYVTLQLGRGSRLQRKLSRLYVCRGFLTLGLLD